MCTKLRSTGFGTKNGSSMEELYPLGRRLGVPVWQHITQFHIVPFTGKFPIHYGISPRLGTLTVMLTILLEILKF